MTLHIQIKRGDVTRWEYRAPPPSSSPAVYREPIRFDPPKSVLLARLWQLLEGRAL